MSERAKRVPPPMPQVWRRRPPYSPPPPVRSTTGPFLALALDGLFLTTVLRGWHGPIVVVLALGFVFLAPGLAWQDFRGRHSLGPEALSLAAAISIGVVITAGLGMNALSVSLTRLHWAFALGGLVALISVADIATHPPRQIDAPKVRGFSRRSMSVIVVVCLGLAGGGAAVSWASEEHWLAGQHYTELYAVAAGDAERLVVHNHEGESVSYRAVISAGGQPTRTAQFVVAKGGTWTELVPVDPRRPGFVHPLLYVQLYRAGRTQVYRQLHLSRLQPAVPPSAAS